MPDKVLVAVAWPYASGSRHLGHVSSFGVPSDVFARFRRMQGHDVLMVSGTDEHGTPITVRAEQEGKTPPGEVQHRLPFRHLAVDAHGRLPRLNLPYDSSRPSS